MEERPIEYCPHCGEDLIGEKIPFNLREHYSPPYFSRLKIGIYNRELDRITHWQCPIYEGTWERK
ncbi:hypothetical protein [Aeribacillus pallidus]|uniref:hypothetical protein n=1 Tax=Aeribacillus pallidus TaxID=33936 RepID=UPI003D1EB870